VSTVIVLPLILVTDVVVALLIPIPTAVLTSSFTPTALATSKTVKEAAPVASVSFTVVSTSFTTTLIKYYNM